MTGSVGSTAAGEKPDGAEVPAEATTSGSWLALFAAWLIALGSTLGALFVGEVMGQVPCNLCWHQRAFMFPLAVILAIAAFRGDTSIWRYAFPIAVIGGLIAGFHGLIYLGVMPEAIEPCRQGPSCASADMTVLSGLPLPLLSFAAFALIATFLLLSRRPYRP
ncbi:disulfide bond formation protein B [Jiella pacifica]|uniref:Disulfide bond formation protein B n=1 Tax=Jiella pacifica TaxID=2696469 RepID=A0A6N9T6A7_9HYPH|nr:disulfide bond formation protein B [Jiella pacifica]MAU95487.1 disulfide bond formation protein B [Fulvimarina sp.]NDW06800.1 disulfide bond formation protein B [Jiella pacifica]